MRPQNVTSTLNVGDWVCTVDGNVGKIIMVKGLAALVDLDEPGNTSGKIPVPFWFDQLAKTDPPAPKKKPPSTINRTQK